MLEPRVGWPLPVDDPGVVSGMSSMLFMLWLLDLGGEVTVDASAFVAFVVPCFGCLEDMTDCCLFMSVLASILAVSSSSS